MKFRSILILALPILSISAWADAFDSSVADVSLLQVKAVQTEVGITSAQRAKLNVHASAHRSKLVAYEARLKSQAQKTKKPVQPEQKVLMGYFDVLRKEVLSELSPAQTRRLRELTLQRTGLVGILDKVVAAKVGVASGPLEKMRTAYVQGAKDAAALEQKTLQPIIAEYQGKKPKNQDEAKKLQDEARGRIQSARGSIQPQLVAIQNKTRDKMLQQLSEPQKAAYKLLQGKPFNWSKA
jgi:hypothetical protein